MFCIYPEWTSDNAPPHQAETEVRPLTIQPGLGPGPNDTVAVAVSRRKPGPKPKAATAAKRAKRNIHKELAEAMSEFGMLKAKLAEVGERVKLLEAKKGSAGLGSAAWRAKLSTSYASQT
jgi:hypothetical protein